MKSNQKGFSVVEMLLAVIAITLIAGVGYFVYSQNSDKNNENSSSSASQSAAQKETETSSEETKKVTEVKVPDLVEYAEPIKIIQKSDVSKLKDTSDEFKAFIATLVTEKPTYEDGCDNPNSITVEKVVKDEFALGGIAGCGGARQIWKKTNTTWSKVDGLGGQDWPACAEVVKEKAPVSIIEKCYEESKTKPGDFDILANPNQ